MLASRENNALAGILIKDDKKKEQSAAAVTDELESVEVDKTLESEEHLLQLAAIYRKVEVVAQLLKHKDQANLQDKDGRTLLHYAAWFGEANVVAERLKHPDINVNLTDERGHAALHHAAFHGNAEAVAVLLRHKETEVNLCDNEGKSPLRLGVFSAEVVAELLRHEDININIQDDLGKAPLHYAVEADMGKSVAELLKHNDIKVNLTDNKGWTPFALAGYCKSGHAAGELLKDKNLQVNLKDKYDWKAIYTAHKKGHIEDVGKFLRSYIANYYNRREKEGAYLTSYGRFFGIHQEAKLAAAGFLLHHIDNLDKIEELESFSAHKAALSDGELGSVYWLLKKK